MKLLIQGEKCQSCIYFEICKACDINNELSGKTTEGRFNDLNECMDYVSYEAEYEDDLIMRAEEYKSIIDECSGDGDMC